MDGAFYLVTYTILSQAAIGLVAMMWFGSRLLSEPERRAPKYGRAFLAAALLSLAAMAVSGLHLGSPLRAMNALFNLGSSWLSREILTTVLFFLCACWGYDRVRKGAKYDAPLLAGTVVGLLCVLCQAAIYASTVMPAWRYGHAYITFFGAAIVIGVFLALLFLCGGKDGAAGEGRAKLLTAGLAAAVLAVVGEAGFYSVFGGLLAGAGKAGAASLELLSGFGALLAVRWLCGAAALIGLGLCLGKNRAGGAFFLLTALALLGEVLQRIVFYGIGVAIGL